MFTSSQNATHLIPSMMFKPLFRKNYYFLTKLVWSLPHNTSECLSRHSQPFPHSIKEQSDVQNALNTPQGEPFNAIIHWLLQPSESSSVYQYQLSSVFIIHSLVLLKFQCTIKHFILSFCAKLNVISENYLSPSEMMQY